MTLLRAKGEKTHVMWSTPKFWDNDLLLLLVVVILGAFDMLIVFGV